MSLERKRAWPECDGEARKGLLPPPYGQDLGEGYDIIPEQRGPRHDESESTVRYQTTGNPSPEDEMVYATGKETTRVIIF